MKQIQLNVCSNGECGGECYVCRLSLLEAKLDAAIKLITRESNLLRITGFRHGPAAPGMACAFCGAWSESMCIPPTSGSYRLARLKGILETLPHLPTCPWAVLGTELSEAIKKEERIP